MSSIYGIPPLVALTSESSRVDHSDLAAIAAALQKQVVRDFQPIWGGTANVATFPDPKRIPVGYWRMVIKDQLDAPGAAGYHTDEHGQPLALIAWEGSVEDVATTCSHELLETLADPFGSRLVAGSVPEPHQVVRAHVLVEACDPCEARTYDVDGLPLSDFVLPRYYGPHRWSNRVHAQVDPNMLTFCGVVRIPMTLAPGGYLSYVTPTGEWRQMTWFSGSRPAVRSLNSELAKLAEAQGSLRGAIDRVTAADAHAARDFGASKQDAEAQTYQIDV